jgi:transcriptional regulator of aromatic amino acid metabolism
MPFVPVVAALSPTLVESQLFGHRKGRSQRRRDHKGFFEVASGAFSADGRTRQNIGRLLRFLESVRSTVSAIPSRFAAIFA